MGKVVGFFVKVVLGFTVVHIPYLGWLISGALWLWALSDVLWMLGLLA